MGATTTFGWPYPDLSSAANGPAAFAAAMQAAEDTVKSTALTTYTPAWSSSGTVQPGGTVTKTGRYRVDNGRCQIWISFLGGATPSGGTGNLSIGLPVAPRSDMAYQYMPAWFFCPYAGGGIYAGLARPVASSLTMPVYFPASSSDTRLSQWRNATEGNGAGTGIPVIPSWYGFIQNSEVVVAGSYFV